MCSKSCEGFEGGRLSNFQHEWENLTSDKSILDLVNGCHLEFLNDCEPIQTCMPHQPVLNKKEQNVVQERIENFLEMKVIEEVTDESTDGFMSTIFVRPKPSSEYRMILNLKELNKFITPHHFKMDTFESSLNLIKKGLLFGKCRSPPCILFN